MNISSGNQNKGLLNWIAPTALGVLGANSAANSYQGIADQYMGLGSAFRDLHLKSYQPGFSLSNEPGYRGALDTAANSFLRAASAGRVPGVSRGNPLDSRNPGAWAETQKYLMGSVALPYLQNYRSSFGAPAKLGIEESEDPFNLGAKARSGVFNSIGYGLGQYLNPKPDYQKQLFDLYRKALGLT